MSATERTVRFIRTILAYQERLDGLDKRLGGLGDGLARLASSHASLRDRVSRLEGIIEGAAMAARHNPRIEG